MRYEIYHDSLGQAILDWRRRHLEQRQRAELEKERRAARRLRWLVAALSVAIGLALAATFFAWVQWKKAEDNAKRASENEQKALESEERAESNARRVADFARQLQTALDEKAKEEAQRKEAEAKILDLEGKSEEAAKLRQEVETERQQSLVRARTLEVLGAALGANGEAEETDLAGLAESQLQQLNAALDRIAEIEKELAEARQTIRSLRRELELVPEHLRPPESFDLPALGMRFRYIPAGRFEMGSRETEEGRELDETFHDVELTHAFWLAETEVTQGQWQQLMGTNPSSFQKCGKDCPVEKVSWFEAATYANRVSEDERLDVCYELKGCTGQPGKDYSCEEVRFKGLDCEGYRLPTEGEWEYAARAGTSTPFWTGDNLTTGQANYNGDFPYAGNPKGQSRLGTMPVRSFAANPWGLYEVHGNVWEWVQDWYGENPATPVRDPTGPEVGYYRVVRGGNWIDGATYCRAANRHRFVPDFIGASLGFRLVKTFLPAL